MNIKKFTAFALLLTIFVTNALFGRDVRFYDQLPTEEDRDNVFFIVSTLGNKSLAKVWKSKSSLKKAGEKIEHLHPLRFLEIVFTNEELKAAMHNLKNRDLMWGEFKGGLYGSLAEEFQRGNLTEEQIYDFAGNIGVDISLFYNAIQQKDWDDMLTILIKNVPREGNPGRYDM